VPRISLRMVAWISIAHQCLTVGLALVSMWGYGEAFDRGELSAPERWRSIARAGMYVLAFPGWLVVRAIRAPGIVDWCIGFVNSGLWGLALAVAIARVRGPRRAPASKSSS